MRARLRAFDWSATPLGPIAGWPQSLKTAVDFVLSSPVPIVMLWGPEGTMIYNDGYSGFAGGRHPGLLGAPVLEGWPEVADFNRHVLDVCLHGGGTLSFRDEPLVLHRHGVPEQVWLDLNYSPIRGESGRPAGVFAIVVETTERVLAERQVRALNAQLEAQVDELAALDRAKTTFFSNISHEFRTPLTLMLGPTEDALASPSRTLGGADLETLHRNELRLLKLVNALLDFSRIEAGRMRAAFAPTDLARATRELVSGFDSAIARAGLRFDIDVEPVDEPVYVDREMWETVVLNLLSNALKYTFQGSIGVALRDRGDRVELAVTDTGIGIAAGELPRLFERFHRVEGARGRTEEGSGIGLALVHDLVKLHGGTVTAESTPGSGTTFRVTLLKGAAHLPADRVQDTVDAPRPFTRLPQYASEALRWLANDSVLASAPAADDQQATYGMATVPGRVLVADDNADMREYLTRVLGAHWTVEAVSDGTAALAAATRHPPDVVLSDVMMGGLDGFQLLRALRDGSRTRHVPVIMLSARAGEEARVEGLQLGADDYLVKPFSARELVARVNSQMALAHHNRERAELLAREQTARAEAERQKQHLHALFMQAPMPIAILRGPDHVIELANPLACQVWGRTLDEVIDRPVLDALPELRDPSQPFRGLLAEVYGTGVPYVGSEIPARFTLADGQVQTVYLTFVYAPFRNLAGAIEGIFALGADVTAQVEARQLIELTQSRLTFALDAAGVGYWDLDLTTHAAMRSLSHDQIFGYPTLLPAWTFEMFLDHVAEEDRARVRASFEQAETTGDDWRFECRIIRHDGVPRWIAAHGRSERAPDGRPLRMLGVVIDITERRELLEQAQQARAEADRASRAKDEFMAMLGHELRNPLAPIQTALHIMRLRGDELAARERTVIQRQVDHLTRLVDDLLDVSRIARGKVELRRAHVELAEAVATALETAGPLVEERGHALDVDVPRRGLAVEGDLVRLAQVIANLLTNAAKYTEPGGRIRVRAGREGGDVVLRIRDTGIGLSADMLPRIFDLFAQAPQTLDRSHGGLGLGLSIVRSLIIQHGGTVTAHSAGPGTGSEFVVRLPAAPAGAADAPAAMPAPAPVSQAAGALNVLVVDDNRDAAEMLAQALSLQGHTPQVALDGPRALQLCESFRPAVALLDLGLPVMDGYELAGRLRRLPGLAGLRIIAVSGYGQESDKQRSRAAGFDAHLVKPIDLDQLERVLVP